MSSNDRAPIKLQHAVRRIVLCVGLALTAGWLVVAGLGAAQAQGKIPLTPRSVAAIDRPEDPVVITGTRFPAFSGVPLSELKLYASHGGGWAAIPFQIDEVNISGTYVISDDSLLDGNDELVFMTGDSGDSVSAANWPADTQARLNPRYVISVTDPLSVSHQAWAYLYRSATLTPSNASYITWTYAAQTAAALSYTAVFSPSKFVGLSDLFINGGNVDILDRQKTRVKAFIFTLNEESIVTSLGPATITLPIAGPVRAVTNNGDLKAAFYGSRLDFNVTFNLSALLLSPDFIRTSFDWNNPYTTSITRYYDSNTPGGVTIDGVPDVISTTPRADWFQVNGGVAGTGGLVMAIPRIDPRGGTVTNYYKDDSTIDSNDTGDKRSYGDSGLRIDGPFGNPAIISFTLVAYVLPPGASANVGATYFARASNPLLATAAQQCYTSSGECVELEVPPESIGVAGPTIGVIGVPSTFTVTVSPISATTPLTYVYRATDQAVITQTNGITDKVAMIWNTAGPKVITVTASNRAGIVTGTHTIDIFVPPASVVVTGTTLARVDDPYTYVASVSPLTASLPLTYVWQATDHSPITVTGGLSSSMAFTWTTLGIKAVSVTSYNIGGRVSSDPLSVLVKRIMFLPLVLKNAP